MVQETRLYDPDKGETRSMRSKEEANDYRYFPDPDLLPVELDAAFIEACGRRCRSCPIRRRRASPREYGLSAYDAGVLTASRELADYYEEVVRDGTRRAEARRQLGHGRAGRGAQSTTVSRSARPSCRRPGSAGLLQRIADQTISGKIAKEVFEAMWAERRERRRGHRGQGPAADHRQLPPSSASSMRCMAKNPGQLADFRSGKDKLFGFFVGQVMKATGGKANPAQLNELLKKKLGG